MGNESSGSRQRECNPQPVPEPELSFPIYPYLKANQSHCLYLLFIYLFCYSVQQHKLISRDDYLLFICLDLVLLTNQSVISLVLGVSEVESTRHIRHYNWPPFP